MDYNYDVQFYVSVGKDNNYDENVISECFTAAEKWLAINNLKKTPTKSNALFLIANHPNLLLPFQKLSIKIQTWTV